MGNYYGITKTYIPIGQHGFYQMGIYRTVCLFVISAIIQLVAIQTTFGLELLVVTR